MKTGGSSGWGVPREDGGGGAREDGGGPREDGGSGGGSGEVKYNRHSPFVYYTRPVPSNSGFIYNGVND